VLHEQRVTLDVAVQVINAAVSLLSGEHDRSRQPAAQLLALLAQVSARPPLLGSSGVCHTVLGWLYHLKHSKTQADQF
jgi:hypothetical protein